MVAQMTPIFGPIIYTEPSSGTRYYYGATPGDMTIVNGVVYTVLAYSDPAEGEFNLQPQTYVGYTITASGAVTQDNALDSWYNADDPQNIPGLYGQSAIRPFSSIATDLGESFVSLNNNGTATYSVAVVNLSGSSPTVTQVDSITVTPVAQTGNGFGTTHSSDPGSGGSQNVQIFEVEGAPANGQVQGTFIIYNSSGTVTVGPATGFNFTDGKAHVFFVGSWQNGFAQFVEAWNQTTGLADIQFSTINSTTGVVSHLWTAATELQSITGVGAQSVTPLGSAMIMDVDGSDAGGRGAFLFDVNDSTGQISASLAIHYSGTVTQDAIISAIPNVANEYYVYWVDGNGLTIDLINSSLQVLETQNIAAANSTAFAVTLNSDELLVSYGVQSSATSSVDDFVILSTVQPPPPQVTFPAVANGNVDEWILANGGQWDASSEPGSIPSGYQAVGTGDFTGNGTSDILWQNSTTGDTQEWLISNGGWNGTVDLGAHPGNYQIAGVGDFTGTGIDDVLWTSTNSNGTIATDIWELNSSGQWQASVSPGTHPAGYQVAAVGDFTGNGTSDILWYNSTTGDVDEWQIINGQWSASVDLGSHPGAGWTIAGVGDFFGNGIDDILWTNSTSSGVQTDIWELAPNGQWEASVSPGSHPAGYQVAAVGNFADTGTDGILWYNPSTGDADEWQLSNGQWSASVDLGSHPGSFQIAGTGAFVNGNATSDVLWQQKT